MTESTGTTTMSDRTHPNRTSPTPTLSEETEFKADEMRDTSNAEENEEDGEEDEEEDSEDEEECVTWLDRQASLAIRLAQDFEGPSDDLARQIVSITCFLYNHPGGGFENRVKLICNELLGKGHLPKICELELTLFLTGIAYETGEDDEKFKARWFETQFHLAICDDVLAATNEQNTTVNNVRVLLDEMKPVIDELEAAEPSLPERPFPPGPRPLSVEEEYAKLERHKEALKDARERMTPRPAPVYSGFVNYIQDDSLRSR